MLEIFIYHAFLHDIQNIVWYNNGRGSPMDQSSYYTTYDVHEVQSRNPRIFGIRNCLVLKFLLFFPAILGRGVVQNIRS